MTKDISDLRHTIIPKSDQLNSEQLLAGPMRITIESVQLGNTPEQPLIVHYTGENGRPYKPCKTMRKLMIFVWGNDGRTWVGRSLMLFCDPSVKFGGEAVGGIRISHMSHIDKDVSVSLTATRGRKTAYNVKPLASEAPPADDTMARLKIAAECGMQALEATWKDTPPAVRKRISPTGCPEALKQIAQKADAERIAAANSTGSAAIDRLNAAIQDDDEF